MAIPSKYEFVREGGWSLCVLKQGWSRDLWVEVKKFLEKPLPARHPQTIRFSFPSDDVGKQFYLKIHHGSSSRAGGIKDLVRDSKAFRALKQGVELAERGFRVPIPIAAGEERKLRVLQKAFLLTFGVEGVPLQLFLESHCSCPLAGGALIRKRKSLKRLAVEIRRLHQCGFVHGDLVPSNILVHEHGEEGIVFFYMDNDRTRHYPVWLPQRLWRRNLVQLNRFILPGISLQDRMRFLRYYLWVGSWGKRERRLIYWLEKKTRQRLKECQQIGGNLGFRELVKWNRQGL